MAGLDAAKLGRRLAVADTAILIIGISACYLMWFGIDANFPPAESSGMLRFTIPSWIQVAFTFLIWVVALAATKSRDFSVLGSDSQEYKRVVMSGIFVPVVFALASLLLKVDVSRLFLGTTLSIGTLLLLTNRWLWRRWLTKKRTGGQMVSPVALVGPAIQISRLARKLLSNPVDGYSPRILVTDASSQADLADFNLPTLSYSVQAVTQLKEYNCTSVIVVGSDLITERDVKSLAWQLEGSGIELLVAPPLEDIAISRLTVKPLAGIPVFVVQIPVFQGVKFVLKSFFDWLFAILALVFAFPIVLICGLCIKLEDSGPVLYKQDRVGINGRVFKMYKLRSMKVGADSEHDQLHMQANTSPNKVMYKNPADPRVTRVGRFIRRSSLDELPQLINVLKGQMSMVGPRPPLPTEVQAYEDQAHRRLLVKPGITGLWQVSGKNSLTWEETVALDLNYVENWSLVGDLLLLAKTVKTVLLNK